MGVGYEFSSGALGYISYLAVMFLNIYKFD